MKKNYLAAPIPSGKGFEESIMATSVDAPLHDGAAEPDVCAAGRGAAGASAGLAFPFAAFGLSLSPWPLATLKFRHLSCSSKHA